MNAELTVAAASEIDPNVFGMPIPLALAVMALFASLVTAVATQLLKRFRTPQDDRDDKVVVLDASDKLIQRFQQIVKDSDEKHAKDIANLSKEVQELRQELEAIKTERSSLLQAVRHLVQLVRKYGGHACEEELQTALQPTGLTLTMY